ncbi:MAG: phosphatidate cytidylyltransferase [Clostridia bacterium]|nr:phosphatidate cytidylyltransferase [Clostridia bacterium]
MKTRIVSAAIMIAIVIGLLTLGYKFNTMIITSFIALLAIAATYEIMCNIVRDGTLFRKAFSCVYAALAFFFVADILHCAYDFIIKNLPLDAKKMIVSITLLLFITIIYIVVFTLAVIFQDKDFSIKEIFALLGVPLLYSAAFASLDCIITRPGGIYYLLLVINFSSICDTGAYFTGVFFGRHKLCEHVSPKKTVEGAIGGIIASLISTVVLVLAFKAPTNILLMLLVTVFMCIVGMLGDLFASIIKRSVGVKDYSNLIPGHGGILDRFDSMLFISPALLSLMLLGIVK